MVMCSWPGCVGEARPGRQACAVHDIVQPGQVCVRCGGTGAFYRAEGVPREPCVVCGGCGFLDKRAGKKRERRVPVDQRPLIVGSEQ